MDSLRHWFCVSAVGAGMELAGCALQVLDAAGLCYGTLLPSCFACCCCPFYIPLLYLGVRDERKGKRRRISLSTASHYPPRTTRTACCLTARTHRAHAPHCARTLPADMPRLVCAFGTAMGGLRNLAWRFFCGLGACWVLLWPAPPLALPSAADRLRCHADSVAPVLAVWVGAARDGGGERAR